MTQHKYLINILSSFYITITGQVLGVLQTFLLSISHAVGCNSYRPSQLIGIIGEIVFFLKLSFKPDHLRPF